MIFLADMQKIILILVLIIFQGTRSQEIVIMDEVDRRPISTVIASNAARSKATLSDSDGTCDLSIFAGSGKLTFSHIGYQIARSTKAQLVGKGKLYMALYVEQLDEVVMSISKWQQQRKDIPQKIAVINAQNTAFAAPQTSADLLS